MHYIQMLECLSKYLLSKYLNDRFKLGVIGASKLAAADHQCLA